MRVSLYIFIFIFGFSSSTSAQNKNSELDSLSRELNSFKAELILIKTELDSLRRQPAKNEFSIGLKDIDKVITELRPSKKTFWIYIKEALPFLIPIMVALVGAYFTLLQLKRQSRYTLIHTRANKLSEARIKWNDDLRKKISELISSSTMLNYHLRLLSDIVIERNHTDKVKNSVKWNELNKRAEDYYNSKVNDINKCIALTSELQLYLDVSNESNELTNKHHIELEKVLSDYSDYTMEYDKLNDVEKFNKVANKLITVSRKVLYDSWAKARNEGNSEINKAYNESYFWKSNKNS